MITWFRCWVWSWVRHDHDWKVTCSSLPDDVYAVCRKCGMPSAKGEFTWERMP